jgi:dienelactone hydrolase
MKGRWVWIVFVMIVIGTSVHGEVVTKSVSYQHENLQLEGYLAYDDSIQGKRPGILVVHEWWGLTDYVRGRAAQLASMGYVAFALDMYGEKKVTQHPEQAGEWVKEVTSNVARWQQRAIAGLEVLKKDPRTDTRRIAAIGYCFGGATVQQLAYSGAEVRGIVSFHGPLQLPLENQAERVKARILICHGGADPFIKREAIQSYLDTMEESGLDWQMIVYSGAKHAFTNPEADKAGMDAMGYSRSADQRSWGHMTMFFEEIFGVE